MTVIPHPVTGVLLNDIHVLRNRKLTEAERMTARLLVEAGNPRWLVAAMMGCFPLAFAGVGRDTRPRMRSRGTSLSLRAARSDPRQASMDALMPAPAARKPKRG